ncbi:unnamed protein product [Caenorhabditis bovis]|uniref:Uncharacterized protein n=1 Tax=Caenorhabditis bovis TaxID=2654633 RepID=A0A8S1EGS8_9PELO|nr:unnamed protein product [Caenorhabditis bovis]
MKSIVFASLIALALAASPAFERTFEPKNEYVYKFNGLLLSGLPSTSTESSQTRISCRVRLQAIDDRYIHLQLNDILVAASHLPESEKMPQLESLESRELVAEHRELLELPVRAAIRNGVIADLEFSNEDSEWSKNVKRAVLNLISFYPSKPLDQEDSDSISGELNSYSVFEKTIEGECQVHYTIVQENEKTIYTKSVNFDKCTTRPEINYGLRFSTECKECNEETRVLMPQTVYTYIFENEKLQTVEVRSIYSLNVNGKEVMKTETRSELIYEIQREISKKIEKVSGPKEELIYSTRWEKRVEEFFKNGDEVRKMPFVKYSTEKKMEQINQIITELEKIEENKPESAHLLARLVRQFRMLTIDELKKVHVEIYKSAEKKTQMIIENACAIAGTKNTIQHLIHHIEKKNIKPTRAAFLIKSVQETPYPSEKIADLLIQLANSKYAEQEEVLRQSVWLAVGTVVRGVTSSTLDQPLIVENSREIKKKYIEIINTLFHDSETTYEKLSALKVLGNAGIDLSVYELNKIILDERQPLAIRMEAIDALRLLKDIMPQKLQKVLLPIYKSRKFAPELRMSALWRLMNTQPELKVLTQVVSQMNKESNQQVALFTYQLLRQYAASTNQCYQKFASDCSTVLSFTRYQPDEQLLSTYYHLPLFSKYLASGAQFNFASIFGKDSVLPKELHASLDTLVGGNLNKYLAQVGFSQQYVDQLLIKALDKFETIERRSPLVRGRRLTNGKNMLKELLNKMNVRARVPVYESKNAHAIFYLRYKEMDYALLPITSEWLEDCIEKYLNEGRLEISSLLRLLNLNTNFEGNQAAYFYEATRKIPTTLGFPLIITGKIPTVSSIKGNVEVKLHNLEARLLLDVEPHFAATHVAEMRIWTPLFEQGVKSLHQTRVIAPFKLETTIVIKKTVEINTKYVFPENKKMIASVVARPVVFLRFPRTNNYDYVPSEEKTIISRYQNQFQEFEKVSKVLGLEITTRGNILNQWTLENWLFNENVFEIVVENRRRPVEINAIWTISSLEKTSLSNIKFDNIFHKKFEIEREEERVEYHNKMIRDIQNKPGYKQYITLKIEGPEDKYLNTELTTICDESVRVCMFNQQIRRSPILEETKEWNLNWELLLTRPETPSSLRQLHEQPHREIQIALKSKWGSYKKSEINCKAQLQQSVEQRKTLRNYERNVNGIPEYELLVKAARLNELVVAADYKLTPYVEKTIEKYFNLLKAYNFWAVSDYFKTNDHREGEALLKLTVEPIYRQYINLTLETPEWTTQMQNIQVPRLYLPSIARRNIRYQISENTGVSCRVEESKVNTFDNVLYKVPLTTCYSAIAKDCTEEPSFAVFAKKVNKNSDKLIVKIYRDQEEILLEKRDEDFLVKVDNKMISENKYEQYRIETLGENLIIVHLNNGEVRFDGYTVKTNLPSYLLKNQLCGLCGNNDDEKENDFKTADNYETEDIEEFHRSYLLKDEECNVEEDRLSEKKNYRKLYDDESDDDDSEEYETEYTFNKKSNDEEFVKRTLVKEYSHRVCFSLEPVAECRRGFESEKTVSKKVQFTCLPRHNSNARRFLKDAKSDILRLEDYPVSYVEAVKLPVACVAY